MKSAIGHRGRALIRIGSWSLIAKICAAANIFGSIPFALAALDGPQFGTWATLVSLMAFSGFFDFGFGNGTMNMVAAAHGRDAGSEVARIIHESRRTLVIVGGMLAAVLLSSLTLVPWHRLIGMPPELAAQGQAAMAAVICAIALSIPLNLGNRVQLGLGRGDRAFRWQAAGQLATLLAIILASRYHPTLLTLTAAAVLTPLLASLGNTLELWRDPQFRVDKAVTPAVRSALRRSIGREGGLFFVLQLAAALSFSADLLLISALRGPSEAGTYAIVQRLFSIIPLALSLGLAPLWPIYRQSLAMREFDWVMRTLRRSVILAGVFAGICATVITIGYESILRAWAPSSVNVSVMLVAGFAVWSTLEASGTAVATFLNSASVLRFQLTTAAAFAVICFTGKAWVILRHDVSWTPWVAVLAYSVTWGLPLLIFWPAIRDSVRARRY